MNNNHKARCPRCGNLVFREGRDLVCLCCGYRKSYYDPYCDAAWEFHMELITRELLEKSNFVNRVKARKRLISLLG